MNAGLCWYQYRRAPHRPAGITQLHGERKAERAETSGLHDVEYYLVRRRIGGPGHVNLGKARASQPLIEEPVELLTARSFHGGTQVIGQRRAVAVCGIVRPQSGKECTVAHLMP